MFASFFSSELYLKAINAWNLMHLIGQYFMNVKNFLLILATLNSSVVIGAEFNAQIFTISGGSVSYLPFSLSQSSLVDIATSSTFIDPEIFLFSGGIGSLGDMLANDDDSCLSVDCGLVGNNQFNALINDYSLIPGDYTVALGASDLTESEARSGLNLDTSLVIVDKSEVLLMVGDENLIIPGEGTGSGTSSLIDFSTTIIDTGSNTGNTAVAIIELCTSNADSIECSDLQEATEEQQVLAVQSITPEEINAFNSSSVATASNSSAGIHTRLENVKTKGYSGGLNISNISLSGSGAGDTDSSILPNHFGLFINANGGFGNKQQTINESGYQFNNGGITVGLDSAINENFILGLAFNYTRTDNNFSNQAGSLTSDAYTGSLFGSYYIDDFYVDMIASIGTTGFNSERNFSYTTGSKLSQFSATGSTSAMQYLTSVNAGYNYNIKGLSITPSVGLNYAMTQVDKYIESGAGIWNSEYRDQDIESLTTTLGANLAYVFSLPWAIITPQLHADWVHEFSYNAQKQTVNFVNNTNSTFIIQADAPDRDYGQIGFNLAAQFTHGIAGFIAYDSIVGRSNVSNNAFSGGIRIEL